MKVPKILIVPGSARGGSLNTRLAASAFRVFSSLDCEVTRISLKDYPLPLFNGDLETQKGPPEQAIKLARLFDLHDGIMLVSPEYNTSVSPLLKNALDWVSRIKGDKRGKIVPYEGKILALASASPGNLGGIRGLSHLRHIITSLGATIIAQQVTVSGAVSAFDDMDNLTNERAADKLNDVCDSLVKTARLLSMK
ncbi:MAG: NAD(P)H-dependent oxidoreductase [Hyphomicrobiales bacterium]|nr:NAD(P)H-dependent oxidoreductase [Hyphomicrobiales bacterium]